MAIQKEIKGRIGSLRNIQKITRAMEMVAAARLRRAEQRIEELRPYARAIRRLTRRVVENMGTIPNLPLLEEHDESDNTYGVLIGHRRPRLGRRLQLADHPRRQRPVRELRSEGKEVVGYGSGRRGFYRSSSAAWTSSGPTRAHTDRPTFADAREIADDLAAAYVDGKVDRVETFHNHYISPLSRRSATRRCCRSSRWRCWWRRPRARRRTRRSIARSGSSSRRRRRSSQRLIPDDIEISIYRRLLEFAPCVGARWSRTTAMHNASENATDLIQDLTLDMNRQRQAEITQEIMEVVAGAEGLSPVPQSQRRAGGKDRTSGSSYGEQDTSAGLRRSPAS